MVFPYVAANIDFIDEHELYESLQRLRGTDCRLINRTAISDVSMRLLDRFGRKAYRPEDTAAEDRFVRFVQCTRMSWLVFRASVASSPRARICAKLHFTRVGEDACRSPRPAGPLVSPEECLP
jgi:hypothetical protein